MHLGNAWYPEHWSEERWDEDLRLMAEAGMTVTRIGEFAWSRLEPSDGDIRLDWLHRAVDAAQRRGIRVVMGTPTAAPPAWLTSAHPEVLPVRDDGRVQRHGMRCHFRPGSEVYRRYCRRIAAAMGQRFGRHPNVIGWQIDNEYWSVSRDEESLGQFRAWLQERFGTLDALNEAWSGAYWSEDYQAWEQIEAPTGGANPGLDLCWRQFNSDLTAGYQRVQVEALREHIEPRQWISHNFHPHDELDRWVIARDLDLLGWDAYIHRTPRFSPADNGADIDRIRGLSDRPVWIMETQPGSVNWAKVNLHQPPGAIRTLAWQSIGHGADAVLYWQWRSAPGGQEQYHGSVVAQDGTPRPRYSEIQRLGREFQRLTPLLNGSRPRNRVAVIDRWRDRYVLRRQPHHHEWNPYEHLATWYGALQRAGVSVDLLDRCCDLAGYDLVVAPHLHLLDDVTTATLAAFVDRGGRLLLGSRSCFKDGENRLHPERQPGPLAGRCGCRVRDHYALAEAVAVAGTVGTGTAKLFAEDLEAEGGEVLLRYDAQAKADAGWLAGRPALIQKGGVAYCGCWPDDALADRVVGRLLDQAGVRPPLVVPAGVEVMTRWKDDQRILIVVNHTDAPARVPLPAAMHDHLAQAGVRGTLDLPGYGVAVLTA